MDGQGIPQRVTSTGSSAHVSRLIGMTLKNSCKMDAWLLMADVRHLCLDKGYDYPRVSGEVHVDGLKDHIRSLREEAQNRHRNPVRRRL